MPATVPLTATASTDAPEEQTAEKSQYPRLPIPPPSILLTPLLGSPQNEHMQTLINIYVSEIATLAWHANRADRLPVVVGIALKASPSRQEDDILDDQERRVYFTIMEMVVEALDSAYQSSTQS